MSEEGIGVLEDNKKTDIYQMRLTDKGKKIVEFGESKKKMQIINLYAHLLELQEKTDRILELLAKDDRNNDAGDSGESRQ